MLQVIAVVLAFLSGFVALGYEILWARRLADVIGATSLASSLVVGVFFLMLAGGAVALGPAASRHRSPWRLYALLELGILAAILPAFFGEALTGSLARWAGDALLHPVASLAVKTFLALAFVGPASFLMGGTLPAMGQACVRAGRLGNEGNILYGANTLGGAAGVLFTTFALVPALGMRGSFMALMLGSLVLSGTAWRLASSARGAAPAGAQSASGAPPPASPPLEVTWAAIGFVSGFNVLGLEILALHLFSQVLHNSTYTFATVLVVVIAALAAGALVTQRWSLDAATAERRLAVVLLLAGVAMALVPRLFLAVTHGMEPLGGGAPTLAAYVLRILGVGTLVLGPPFVLAGWVFPLVLAGAGARGSAVGSIWGRLLAVNAAGALLGLVAASFAGMRFLGLWLSLASWSMVATTAGIVLALRAAAPARRALLFLAAAGVAVLAATWPRALPVASLVPGERLLASSTGADGVAAVIAQPGRPPDRRIKWNNHYTLGGTANAAQQARLGHLALLLHPRPERVGFIGIATGITASAALHDPDARSITAIELSGQVTSLACRYFADTNARLCASPRARVVVEDGRLFFRATRQQFDVVVGDLFVPWQAGTANLYTREHFAAVRDHLAPDGLFAQWLPLFQLDARGFWGIAATFCDVFPNAWLAVADFQPHNPAVALVGWRMPDGGPAYDVIAARCARVQGLRSLREPMLDDASGVGMFLVGPAAPALPAGIPVMTLDRPWLADHAPRVQRARPPRFLVGAPLVAALQTSAAHAPAGPLRAPMALGQQIYEYCDRYTREGPERAAAWFDAQAHGPLPRRIFAVPEPATCKWPFTQPTGMFLIGRGRSQTP